MSGNSGALRSLLGCLTCGVGSTGRAGNSSEIDVEAAIDALADGDTVADEEAADAVAGGETVAERGAAGASAGGETVADAEEAGTESIADKGDIKAIAMKVLTFLFNSCATAYCVAPTVIVGACILVAWNERRSICSELAHRHGQDAVMEVGCDSVTGSDQLVLFSCDLQRDGLPVLTASADFEHVLQFQGVGLQTVAEIYQCVESSSSSRQKDPVSGGTTTITTFTYQKQWVAAPVDSSSFSRKDSDNYRLNCGAGAENPSWPSGAPVSSTQYTTGQASIGPYSIPHTFLEQLPLDTPLVADSTPSGWFRAGDGYILQSNSTSSQASLGDVRVRFYGNDWSSTTTTVLGLNINGALGTWTSPDSRFCPDFELGDLQAGRLSKEDLFAGLNKSNVKFTTGFRIVAFVLLWFGFGCLFKGRELYADCAPCLGSLLGDKLKLIITVATCPVALACQLGAAGALWVAFLPRPGIIMLSICGCCFCCFFSLCIYNRSAGHGVDEEQPEDAEADSQPCVPAPELVGEQPGTEPGAQPGTQPGAQPEAQPGAQPEAQPEVQPDARIDE